MKVVFVLIVLVVCAASRVHGWAGSSAGGGMDEDDAIIFGASSSSHDANDDDVTFFGNGGGAVQPSPRCWKTATQVVLQMAMSDNNNGGGGADSDEGILARRTGGPVRVDQLCAALPEDAQKLLALEIASCHLMDVGKAMFQSNEQNCLSIRAPTQLHVCLKHLTNAGFHAYTHFVAYVHQLCVRLTQELVAQQQQQLQHALSQQYTTLAQSSIQHLQDLVTLSQQQSVQLTALAQLPRQIQAQLATELPETIQRTIQQTLSAQLARQLHEQLDDRLRQLLQAQSLEQAHFAHALLDELGQRDATLREQHQVWTQQQQAGWQHQSQELQRQQVLLTEQRQQMEQLAAHLGSTHALFVRPLLQLQSLLDTATHGYNWTTWMVHVLVSLNILWLLTRPATCAPVRPYLFAVASLSAVTEMGLGNARVRNVLPLPDDMAHADFILNLRHATWMLELVIFLLGLLAVTCGMVIGWGCRRRRHRQAQGDHPYMYWTESSTSLPPPALQATPTFSQHDWMGYATVVPAPSGHDRRHALDRDRRGSPPVATRQDFTCNVHESQVLARSPPSGTVSNHCAAVPDTQPAARVGRSAAATACQSEVGKGATPVMARPSLLETAKYDDIDMVDSESPPTSRSTSPSEETSMSSLLLKRTREELEGERDRSSSKKRRRQAS